MEKIYLGVKLKELRTVPISEVNKTLDYLNQSYARPFDTGDICHNYSCKLMTHETLHCSK